MKLVRVFDESTRALPITYWAASDAGDGPIMPTWTAVDTANVRTMRELMENMRKDGWNVEVKPYHSSLPYFSHILDVVDPSIIGMFREAISYNHTDVPQHSHLS